MELPTNRNPCNITLCNIRHKDDTDEQSGRSSAYSLSTEDWRTPRQQDNKDYIVIKLPSENIRMEGDQEMTERSPICNLP